MSELATNKERFYQACDFLKIPAAIDRELLHDLFQSSEEGTELLKNTSDVFANLPVNPMQVLLYLAHELAFFLGTHKDISCQTIKENEDMQSYICSIAVDKYFTNEHLQFKTAALSNRYTPEISTITLYLNFVLGILSRYKMNDPNQSLLVDMLHRGFTQAKCVVDLLTSGYETEAFACWRTLHEIECIFITLIKNGEPTIVEYLRHINFARAFRHMISSTEETDSIFVDIKEGMRKNNLKSKDMKKFIEYGWLYSIPGVNELEGFKLNFRDGVERCAGLKEKSEIYEMSSEIAHSSPLLIYSDNRKAYYYLISTINLYESFFRLEKYFASFYLSKLPENEKSKYFEMRNKYLGQLQICYQANGFRLNEMFKASK